jgi:hypothetical protein
MILTAFIALGLALAVAACAAGGGATALGTIAGNVVAGPTCPVENVTQPCPPEPVQHRLVTVMTPSGAEAARTTTDSSGNFSVQVTPGNYIVQVQIVRNEVGLRQTTPGDVTVHAGETTMIHIELDTGIR